LSWQNIAKIVYGTISNNIWMIFSTVLYLLIVFHLVNSNLSNLNYFTLVYSQSELFFYRLLLTNLASRWPMIGLEDFSSKQGFRKICFPSNCLKFLVFVLCPYHAAATDALFFLLKKFKQSLSCPKKIAWKQLKRFVNTTVFGPKHMGLKINCFVKLQSNEIDYHLCIF
jgi:hypothetical protein